MVDCKCKSCKCGDMTMEQLVSNINDQTKPFTEHIISDSIVIRTFETGYPDYLYKWHADDETRILEVLEDNDWRFQYDNELPVELLRGVDVKIPVGVIHRLIPGTTQLILKVNKIL